MRTLLAPDRPLHRSGVSTCSQRTPEWVCKQSSPVVIDVVMELTHSSGGYGARARQPHGRIGPSGLQRRPLTNRTVPKGGVNARARLRGVSVAARRRLIIDHPGKFIGGMVYDRCACGDEIVIDANLPLRRFSEVGTRERRSGVLYPPHESNRVTEGQDEIPDKKEPSLLAVACSGTSLDTFLKRCSMLLVLDRYRP